MTRTVFLFIASLVITGCSFVPTLDEVLTDKRTEYKKSETMPDLEVPPDLTAVEGNPAMSIPGENRATMSEYRRQTSGQSQAGQTSGGNNGTGQTGETTTPASAPVPASNVNWVVVEGTNEQVWPRLARYFVNQGYELDLNDAELGVLGTTWSEPYRDGGFVYRERFKVFSEPGTVPDQLVLYIANERQEQVNRSGSLQWIDQGNSLPAEYRIAGELDRFFNGERTIQQPVSSTAVAMNTRPPEIQNLGNGRKLLIIPEEYTSAWRRVEDALASAGLVISGMNQTEGFYNVTYYAGGRTSGKKGWLSKLKFWDRDERPAGSEYTISLTGVGARTELIVLDDRGNWANSEQATDVLELIRSHYNRSS